MFSAPEIQHKSVCSLASDMFSLGMLMVATFNGGQSLIQANHSTNLYFKQAGVVSYPKRRVYCEEVHSQKSKSNYILACLQFTFSFGCWSSIDKVQKTCTDVEHWNIHLPRLVRRKLRD